MKKVLVFGTFDLLHEGHVSFFRQVARMGDRVIASVSRDEYVRRWKGKNPNHPEHVHLKRLLDRGLVAEAHLSDPAIGTYALVQRINPDVICLGYDQDRLKDSLEAWMESERVHIPIRVMDYYPTGKDSR